MKAHQLVSWISIALIAGSAHAQGAVTTSCTTTSGHHIYAETQECPIGGEKYTALQLGTHSTYGSYLDLTRVSYLKFPIAVPVCPSNGFVDFKEDYTPAELQAFKTVIESEAYKALLGKHTSYYLMARMIEMAGVGDYDLWWLDNVAASEAESCELPVFDDYVRRSLASADAALAKATPADKDYWPLQLTAINRMRGLGQFEQASARVAALTGIPDDWTEPFATLKEAIARKRKDRVEIGAKFQ